MTTRVGLVARQLHSGRDLSTRVAWVASATVFIALPISLLVFTLAAEYASNAVAVDFRNAFYPAANALLHGASPYSHPAGTDPGVEYVYTPTAAVLFLPTALLPLAWAQALVSIAMVAALVGTLVVLGVHDWRVHGLVLLWPSYVSAVQTANLTILLALVSALAWRMRFHRYVPGVLVGLAIALKVFMWPLAVWLLATRRFAAFGAAMAMVIASVVSVVPFTSLRDFVHLVRSHTASLDDGAYTLAALLKEAGVPSSLATVIWLAVGLSVLAVGRRSFGTCVVAAILLSPIVWLHYFVLLIVPLAISRAKLAYYGIPLVMWLAPGWENGRPWQTGLVLLVTGVVALACTAEIPRRPRARLTLR